MPSHRGSQKSGGADAGQPRTPFFKAHFSLVQTEVEGTHRENKAAEMKIPARRHPKCRSVERGNAHNAAKTPASQHPYPYLTRRVVRGIDAPRPAVPRTPAAKPKPSRIVVALPIVWGNKNSGVSRRKVSPGRQRRQDLANRK